MSELTPPQGVSPQENPSSNGSAPEETGSTNQDHAAKRLAEEKAELLRKNEELEAKLRAKELDELPEDEQVEQKFQLLASKEVMANLDASVLEGLPVALQNQIKSDPFKLVPQEEIDSATKYAQNRREYYDAAAKAASDWYKNTFKSADPAPSAPTQPEQPKDADPTPKTSGPASTPGAMTLADAHVLKWTDPEKFKQLRDQFK